MSGFPELRLGLGPGLRARAFSIASPYLLSRLPPWQTTVSPFSVFGAPTDQNRVKSGAKFPDGSRIHLGIWLGDANFPEDAPICLFVYPPVKKKKVNRIPLPQPAGFRDVGDCQKLVSYNQTA